MQSTKIGSDNTKKIAKIVNSIKPVKVQYYLENSWPDDILYQFSLAGVEVGQVNCCITEKQKISNLDSSTHSNKKMVKPTKKRSGKITFNCHLKGIYLKFYIGLSYEYSSFEVYLNNYVASQLVYNIVLSDEYPENIQNNSDPISQLGFEVSLEVLELMSAEEKILLSKNLDILNKFLLLIQEKNLEINYILEEVNSYFEMAVSKGSFETNNSRQFTNEDRNIILGASIANNWKFEKQWSVYLSYENKCDYVNRAGFFLLIAITNTIIYLKNEGFYNQTSLGRERYLLVKNIQPLDNLLQLVYNTRILYSKNNSQEVYIKALRDQLSNLSIERISYSQVSFGLENLISYF